VKYAQGREVGRSVPRCAAVVLVLAPVLGFSPGASASDGGCPLAQAPWLRLEASSSVSRPWAASVAAHLGIELASRGVAVCLAPAHDDTAPAPPDAPPPLAVVELRLDPTNLLEVAIVDRSTGNRLTREVALDSIPQDARPLGIALAADELLRASWLEALIDQRKISPDSTAPVTVPAHVDEPVRPAAPPALSPAAELSVWGAGEHATGGLTLGGFDARAAWGRRVEVQARLGYRAGASVSAAHGDIESNALLGGLSLAYAFMRRESPWGAQIFVRVDVARVAFVGQAAAGATGSSGSALTELAGGGVSGWRSLGEVWRIVGELSVSAPLRPVAAVDTGHDASTLSGAVVGLAVGVSAGL
jgi:hypothetical protein